MGFVLIAVIAATSFVSSWLTRKEEHQIQSAAAAVREATGGGCCAKSGAEASGGKQTGCGYRAVA